MANSYYTIVLSTIYFVIIWTPFKSHATTGFHADLIHRDSPLSPFYNPSETTSTRAQNAFLRSKARVKRLFSKNKISIQSTTLIYSVGEYYMNISIGTPPVSQPVLADTGSDLTWTQCQPCVNCYKQLAPIFDPSKSTSFKEIPCESPPCKAVGRTNYCTPQNICEFNYSYADGSYTNGRVATETISISSVSLPNINFGCGYNIKGVFDEQGSGVLGLGRGSLSFVNQFSPSIERKVAHCFVPTTSNVPSKIFFGSEGVVAGPDVVSTPILSNGTDAEYFYLAIDAISVGETKISHVSANNNNKNGDNLIVIDSGTTYTSVASDLYDGFEAALISAISGQERAKDPTEISNLCYKSVGDFVAPTVTIHFRGADVRLNTESTFIRRSDNIVCLTILPAFDVPIYGTLSQINFLVGYDVDALKVSFKPTDCSTI